MVNTYPHITMQMFGTHMITFLVKYTKLSILSIIEYIEYNEQYMTLYVKMCLMHGH